MPRPIKSKNEELSRDEAQCVVDWLVNTMHFPPPRGGKFHLLHRTPLSVAEEYEVKEIAIINAARRKIAETA
jgi:hypothetical protein